MNRYPEAEFPKTILRPEIVAKHEELIRVLEGTVEDYAKIGRRDSSMFDWTLRVIENLGLSTVDPQYLCSLSVIKTKFALWEVLLDDLVDNVNARNFKLFDELLNIPFEPEHINLSKLNAEESKYLEITKTIWNSLISEIERYPKYKKYKNAFDFDVLQLLNALRYSKLVNESSNLTNIIENEAYVPHSMQIMIQMDLDLMCSNEFNDSELGDLRQLNYLSQKMAKIGNLIGTYPRELIESDMSSEAVVKFVKEHGNDFRFKLNKLLNKESRYPKFEEEIIEEWQKLYWLAKETAKEIKSIDTDRFLQEREFIQEVYQKKADLW
ncbi:MAG: hypothetical protein ACREBH_00520 [Candidatus Micrarchaeaceae archaeon]